MMTPVTKQITIEGIDAATFFAMFNRLEQMIADAKNSSLTNRKSDDLLTRSEAAQLLGISMPTLHSYINKGYIQSNTIGRKVRIKRSDVEAALVPVRRYRK